MQLGICTVIKLSSHPSEFYYCCRSWELDHRVYEQLTCKLLLFTISEIIYLRLNNFNLITVIKVKYTQKVIEVFTMSYGKCSLYASTFAECLYKGTIIKKKMLFHIITIWYLLIWSFESSGLHLETILLFIFFSWKISITVLANYYLVIVYLYSIDNTFVSMCNRYIILYTIYVLLSLLLLRSI